MKEVVIQAWCDACRSEDVREAAVRSVNVSLGDAPKTLDLCEAHEKELIEPLEVVVRAFGVRLDKPPAKMLPKTPRREPEMTFPASTPAAHGIRPAPTEWPPCPSCGKVYDTAAALISHIYSVERVPKPDYTKPCPTCGEVSKAPNAASTHRIKEHGYSPLDEALRRLDLQMNSRPVV